MAETKIISKIRKSSMLKKRISEEKHKRNYLAQAIEGLRTFDDLYVEIEKCWELNEAIFLIILMLFCTQSYYF